MAQTLADRIAIVTGSGRGLGREMALGLAAEGARVVITDVDADVVAESVEIIRAKHGNQAATAITIDLSAPGAAESLVSSTIAQLGGLHIVVNNAGIGPQAIGPDLFTKPRKVWEFPAALWHATFAVNTHAPFHMICAAVPHLLKQNWGRVINVTTSLDTMIRVGLPAYGASKAANEALSSVASQDLQGTGVTMNVLVPGGPANTRMIPKDTPIKREDLIQPQVMVAPLQWLVSDAAAGVNGRRFLAAKWDPQRSPQQNMEAAGAPIAWPQLAGSIWPGGKRDPN